MQVAVFVKGLYQRFIINSVAVGVNDAGKCQGVRINIFVIAVSVFVNQNCNGVRVAFRVVNSNNGCNWYAVISFIKAAGNFACGAVTQSQSCRDNVYTVNINRVEYIFADRISAVCDSFNAAVRVGYFNGITCIIACGRRISISLCCVSYGNF